MSCVVTVALIAKALLQEHWSQISAHLVAGQAQSCLHFTQLSLLQAQAQQDSRLTIAECGWQLAGQVQPR